MSLIIKKKIKCSRNFEFQSFVQPLFLRTFRENIRVFLRKYYEVEDYKVEETMRVWRTFLVKEGGGFVLPLYIIEERVKKSCNHCHPYGWNDHLLSKRQYHFIIPIDGEWNDPLDDDVLRRKTHILHGLIHCNGFGHLLCVNGIEGGSSFVRGKEVIALWDRICTSLRCREISLVDTSTKHGIDLQLLCGLSNRQTWFEEWGYRYSQGSSDVNKDTYDNALEEIRSLGPADCVNQEILNRYMRVVDGTEFESIGQLVGAMLTKLTTLTPEPIDIDVADWAANLVHVGKSHATVQRYEQIVGMVVGALQQVTTDDGYVDRSITQMLVRKRLMNQEWVLLDYVLERINGVIVGGHVIRREENPRTHLVRHLLQEIAEVERPISKSDIYEDLSNLYRVVLMKSSPETVGTVLGCKNFTKKWRPNADAFTFRVAPLIPMEREKSVAEQLVVPPQATIRDIKREAEITMSDTYFDMENLKITEIVNLEGIDDDDLFLSVLNLEQTILVRASEAKDPEVKCTCGVRDMDGQHMVQCALCGGLQHSSCIGFHEPKQVPPFYMCNKCYEQKVLKI